MQLRAARERERGCLFSVFLFERRGTEENKKCCRLLLFLWRMFFLPAVFSLSSFQKRETEREREWTVHLQFEKSYTRTQKKGRGREAGGGRGLHNEVLSLTRPHFHLASSSRRVTGSSLFLSSRTIFGLRDRATTPGLKAMAPCSFQTPRTAQLRLPSSRATPRVASRQFAKARPTSAAAAARRASDAGGGDSRNTAAAASATADFAVSCPWPRPPSSYAESPSEQELPIRRRAALFVAKVSEKGGERERSPRILA